MAETEKTEDADAQLAEMAAAEVDAPDETVTDTDDAGADKAGDKDDGKGAKKADEKPKLVDIRALHQARGETKTEKTARLAAEARAERMERRFDEMQRRLTEPKDKPEADAEPNFDQNPAEWLRWDSRRKDKKIEDLSAWKQNQERGGQQSSAMQQFQTTIAAAEQEYAVEKPDYADALSFVQQNRLDEFLETGMTRAEALQSLQGDTIFIAQNALKAGKNPAAVVYALAVRRGYKAKGASADDKIVQLQRGQAAGSKLSGGGEGAGDLSLKRLAELDDDEFDKEWDNAKKAGKLG